MEGEKEGKERSWRRKEVRGRKGESQISILNIEGRFVKLEKS